MIPKDKAKGNLLKAESYLKIGLHRIAAIGRPETIAEYNAIIKFKPEIAEYIDTDHL